MKDDERIKKLNSIILVITLAFFLISYTFKATYYVVKEFSVYITCLLLCGLSVLNYKKLINKNKKMLFILPVEIIFLIIGLIINSTGLGSITQMIEFLAILLILPNIEILPKLLKIIEIILGCCFVLFCIFNKDHLNPNYVGYLYLCYYLFLIIILDLKQKKHKIIYAIASGIIAILIWLTKCRTALLGMIIANILLVLPNKIYGNNIFQKASIPSLTLGNLVVVFSYVQLWKNQFKVDLSAFTSKSLYSGRNRIWNEVFSLILKNPIIGVGSHYQLESHPAYALHNSILMITATFGIPSLIIFIVYFANFIKKISQEKMSQISRKKIFTIIITLFIIDFFESYLYWSAFNILFFVMILYIVNKEKIPQEKSKTSIYLFEEGIDRMGGVERIISTLANELIKKYKVNVISFYKTRECPFFDYNDKVTINYLSKKKDMKEKRYFKNKLLYYILRCIQKIKDKIYLTYKIEDVIKDITDEDVVIFGRTDVAIKVLPHLESCKKVIVRDAIHLEYQKERVKKKIRKIFPGKVNLLIVSSDESIDTYKKYLKDDNINIKKIYNPLGIVPIQKNNIDSKTIIAVGRYSFQKGFENLIKAYSYIRKEYPDWKLKIVGNNDNDTNFKKQIGELGIKDGIILANNTKNIVEQLNDSSIFVMTSRYEGYANALVEALACGVPSISYNWLQGANEIIQNDYNGTLVELINRYDYAKGIDNEQDIINLSNAVIELINDREKYDRYAKNAVKINETRDTQLIISKWIKEIEK